MDMPILTVLSPQSILTARAFFRRVLEVGCGIPETPLLAVGTEHALGASHISDWSGD